MRDVPVVLQVESNENDVKPHVSGPLIRRQRHHSKSDNHQPPNFNAMSSSKSSVNGSSNNERVPWLAQVWINRYKAVPKFNFPGTRLEISFSLASAVFLLTVRVVAEQVLESVFDWPKRSPITKEAAASVAGVVHSLNLVPALILCLSTQPYAPTERISVAPLWWQQVVNCTLQFCTGYMIYDGIVNIIVLRWEPGQWAPALTGSDLSFLFHHFVTSFYMTSTRVIQAGHMSAMMCMFLGESTNPFHNSYLIAEAALKLDCCNGSLSRQLHSIIELCFSSSYCFFRIVLAPVFCLHMTYDILITKRGRTNIPIALRILWTLMIWAVVFGSIPWIVDCWAMLQKHLPLVAFKQTTEL